MLSEYWNENISTQADEPTLFEDLFAQAAQNFPPNDGKHAEHIGAFRMSPMSPFSSSSGSSSTQSAFSPDTWSESDNSDTEIDPLLLEELRRPASEELAEKFTCAQPFPKVEPYDSPFLPPTRYSSPVARTGVLLSTHVKLRESASASPPPFITVNPPLHRFTRRSLSVASSADGEYEVDSDNDGDVSDDEYVPSPALSPHKRSRSSTASFAHPKKPLHPSLTRPIGHRPTKRARQAPPSRNVQAISPAAVRTALAAARNKTQLTCIACNWTQTNGRMPDFKRHLKTHLRPDDKDQTQGWWCKGVLLEDAAEHGLPKSLKPFLFADQWRVGGCERTFSRRDALKRHLDNENVGCVGRPCDASED